jgi:hypothetical protein
MVHKLFLCAEKEKNTQSKRIFADSPRYKFTQRKQSHRKEVHSDHIKNLLFTGIKFHLITSKTDRKGSLTWDSVSTIKHIHL